MHFKETHKHQREPSSSIVAVNEVTTSTSQNNQQTKKPSSTHCLKSKPTILTFIMKASPHEDHHKDPITIDLQNHHTNSPLISMVEASPISMPTHTHGRASLPTSLCLAPD